MNRIVTILILTSFAIVGCATQEAEKDTRTADESASTTATPPAQPVVEPPAPDPEPEIAQIGPDEWFTYTDGVEVQVTGVTSTKVDSNPYIDGWDAGPGVVVTVTIANRTAAVFDTALASVLLTYGPNGEAAEDRYEGTFSGSIPPGRSATADYTFGVVPAEHQGDLLVEVAPSWDHESAFFEGAAT